MKVLENSAFGGVYMYSVLYVRYMFLLDSLTCTHVHAAICACESMCLWKPEVCLGHLPLLFLIHTNLNIQEGRKLLLFKL